METTKLNYVRTQATPAMRNMKAKVLEGVDIKAHATKLNVAGGQGMSFSVGDKFNILGFVAMEYEAERPLPGTNKKKFDAVEMDIILKRTRNTDVNDQFKNTSIRKFLEEWPDQSTIDKLNFVNPKDKEELESFISRNAGYTGPKFIANVGAPGFIDQLEKLAWGEDASEDNTITINDTVRFSYTRPNESYVESGTAPQIYTFNISLYTFGI